MDVCTFEKGNIKDSHLAAYNDDQFAYEYPSTVDNNFYLSQRNVVKMTKTGEPDYFWIGFQYDPASPDFFTPELWVTIQTAGSGNYDQYQFNTEGLVTLFRQENLPKIGKKTITLFPTGTFDEGDAMTLTVRF